MPAPDHGDDFVSGRRCAGEGLRLLIVIFEEAVDRGLQVNNRSKNTALDLRFVRVAKKPSTALSQDADVGVKWSVRARMTLLEPSPNIGMLVGGVGACRRWHWIVLPAGTCFSMTLRKRMNS